MEVEIDKKNLENNMSMKKEEKEYLIPESQLFRLMEGCALLNGCKKYGQEGCECSNQSLLSEANLVIGNVDTDRLLESEFNSCGC